MGKLMDGWMDECLDRMKKLNEQGNILTVLLTVKLILFLENLSSLSCLALAVYMARLSSSGVLKNCLIFSKFILPLLFAFSGV
jgi:hypothetical protein